MRRDDVLAILRREKPRLMEKYGVTGLVLFGSVARDEAGAESDVDVFIQGADMGFFKLFELVDELEEALGNKVDVVTDHAGLRPLFRNRLAQDGVHV